MKNLRGAAYGARQPVRGGRLGEAMGGERRSGRRRGRDGGAGGNQSVSHNCHTPFLSCPWIPNLSK